MRRFLHLLACLPALGLLASCGLFGIGGAAGGIRATVVLSSAVPDPAEADYADCLIHLQFRAENSGSGLQPGDTFVGVMWAFRDRELTDAAWLRPGDVITAKLVAFDAADPKLHKIMRIDDTDDFLSPLLWIDSWEGIKLSEKSKRGLRAEGRFNPFIKVSSAARRERVIEVFRAHGGRPFGGVGQNFLFRNYDYLYNDSWGDSGHGQRGAAVSPFDSILGFKRELDALGIQLIVLFSPSTVSVFPDYATNETWSFEQDGRVDVHAANFFDHLRSVGVTVVDPVREFIANRFEIGPDGETYPIFVFHDQHWSPRGAQIAARQVSAKIKSAPWFRESSISRADPAVIFEKKIELEKVSDVMLFREKKEKGTVYVVAHRNVRTPANSAIFDPDSPEAVIHLIGDSFTVYHSKIQSSFAEHLVAELGMPVQVFFTLGTATTTAVSEWIRKAEKRNLKAVVWQVHPGYLSQKGAWKNISIGGENIVRLIDVFDRAAARSPLVQTEWSDGVMAGYQTAILADFPQSESAVGNEPFRIVWNELSLGGHPVFRTQVANGAMNWVQSDGIDFQVFINGMMIARKGSMRTWQDWRVDLSPFANQTVDFELRADPRTSTQGDRPRWGNPEIWDAQFE